MMLRPLNLLLVGFSASPFRPFRRWSPRSIISFLKAVPSLDLSISSSSQSRSFSLFLLPRCTFHVKALQVPIGDSESCPVSDAAASPSAVSLMANYAHQQKYTFCQFCGNPTKQAIPEGDEKMRAVCTVCGVIHYENPKMVVGCLVEHDGKVLLCKRNIQPSYGLWTLPAGYLEVGESTAEGAMRETFEEANAEVEITSPFAQLDIPHIGQYRAISYSEQK